MKWLAPIAAAGAGYVVGRFLDRVALRKLETLCAKTGWEGDDIIVRSLEGVTTVLFTAAGAYVAVVHLPVKPAMTALLVKVLQVVVIMALTVTASSLASGFGELYSGRLEHGLKHTSILTNIVRIVVVILGGLIVLQTLGISITPILTALGVGGLAVALALQDTLSNLFSGFHITVSGQIRQGDYIKLESGDEGHVVDVSWRFTSIRTLANNMVIVPNSKLASVIVTNYHQPEKELAVLVPVRIPFPSDLAKVERMVVEVGSGVMKSVAGGVPAFEPVVRFHTFGDNGIELTVVLRAAEFTDQYLLKHEFVRRLHERFGREGLEFSSPTRTVRLVGGPAPEGGSRRLAWILVLSLSWAGLSSVAAQPEEGAQPQPEASAGTEGETATVPKPEPKAKAKKGAKAKTKKETAEEKYRRSKYFAVIPGESSTWKIKADGSSSGKASQGKGKKGKKGEASAAKKCNPAGEASCSAGDGCDCCKAQIDCEELSGCQWRPRTEGDEKLEVGAGQCIGKAAAQ